MSQSFSTHRLVEFADTDMAGIAHFSAFFRWMEAAEHEFLRSLGLSVYTQFDSQQVLSFPRVNATCDYRAPARCEELLQIDVTVKRLGTKSIAYQFKFSNGAGSLLAEGEMTSVCCQIQHGQLPESIPLPTVVTDKLRPYVTT